MKIKVDLPRLQGDLPDLLQRVEAGDTIVICKEEEPIAEIRPVKKRRPLGLAKGEITILPSFYDPLPEEIIEGFEGKSK